MKACFDCSGSYIAQGWYGDLVRAELSLRTCSTCTYVLVVHVLVMHCISEKLGLDKIVWRKVRLRLFNILGLVHRRFFNPDYLFYNYLYGRGAHDILVGRLRQTLPQFVGQQSDVAV